MTPYNVDHNDGFFSSPPRSVLCSCAGPDVDRSSVGSYNAATSCLLTKFCPIRDLGFGSGNLLSFVLVAAAVGFSSGGFGRVSLCAYAGSDFSPFDLSVPVIVVSESIFRFGFAMVFHIWWTCVVVLGGGTNGSGRSGVEKKKREIEWLASVSDTDPINVVDHINVCLQATKAPDLTLTLTLTLGFPSTFVGCA